MANVTLESGLLTVVEAAQLLRLKPSTIRDWLLRKRITYYKIGRRVFLRRADLQELISNCRVPALPR